ncbi:hypothetical protein DCAR_0520305 [Daucus carota subsp. sativus]|uniref:Uncharacterized protein n=1 Tax=Daucus carota subsp. sativus TaxID=79200 RepID=A0A164YG56_DAUCS|nr:hypothetical protein DCAR_0520305 [Daucus carota subsp. sativus]
MAHLVTIPTTGTGINLALCLQSSMEKRKPGMIDYVFLELDSLPKRLRPSLVAVQVLGSFRSDVPLIF